MKYSSTLGILLKFVAVVKEYDPISLKYIQSSVDRSGSLILSITKSTAAQVGPQITLLYNTSSWLPLNKINFNLASVLNKRLLIVRHSLKLEVIEYGHFTTFAKQFFFLKWRYAKNESTWSCCFIIIRRQQIKLQWIFY